MRRWQKTALYSAGALLLNPLRLMDTKTPPCFRNQYLSRDYGVWRYSPMVPPPNSEQSLLLEPSLGLILGLVGLALSGS